MIKWGSFLNTYKLASLGKVLVAVHKTNGNDHSYHYHAVSSRFMLAYAIRYEQGLGVPKNFMLWTPVPKSI